MEEEAPFIEQVVRLITEFIKRNLLELLILLKLLAVDPTKRIDSGKIRLSAGTALPSWTNLMDTRTVPVVNVRPKKLSVVNFRRAGVLQREELV